MNQFIEFLKEYWFQLAAALAFVLEIIFIFIKRKPKSICDFKLFFEEALSLVPDFVIKVEEPGNGKQKLFRVTQLAIQYISRKLGRALSDDEVVLVSDAIVDRVETVLCTPTKKEKINEN